MNYIGDYTEGLVYGTLGNQKAKVTTDLDDTFLFVELSATFGTFTWSHEFEVPFFNGEAELFFENFIHSLITEIFNTPSISDNEIQFHDFDLAAITLVLNEKLEGEIEDTHTVNFHLALGAITPVAITDFATGTKQLLNVENANVFSNKHILSFSYLSGTNPTKILINNVATDLPEDATTKKLHSVSIPASLIISSGVSTLSLKLEFADTTQLDLGSFDVLPNPIEHHIVSFQNQFGALSIFEFCGETKEQDSVKVEDFLHENNPGLRSSTSSIEIGKSFTLNTGNIWDATVYKSLLTLLKSFNIFLIKDAITQRVVLSGSQKLEPYKTNETEQNEDIKFKTAENGNIYYGLL